MEQSKSPENAGQKPRDPDLVSKMKSGKVTTLVIDKERLPFYLRVALETGFKVKKIANEGGKFPILYHEGGIAKVSQTKVQEKDRIAVSVEKPEVSNEVIDRENINAFWGRIYGKIEP